MISSCVQEDFSEILPPVENKPGDANKRLLAVMDIAYNALRQQRLNEALYLAQEAASGKGKLIDCFVEIGRRFGSGIKTQATQSGETSDFIPFSFEGKEVRVMTRDGAPWWMLTDVSKVLGIRNAPDAANRLDTDEKSTVVITDSGNLNAERTIINESGLWSLVLTSRKPEAKRFKKWLTSEVIPSIRKTGRYSLSNLATPPRQSSSEKKKSRRPDVLFRLLKQIALDAGKNEQEAIFLAGSGVRAETGLDISGLIGVG